MTTETRIDNAFRASIRSVTDEVQIGLLSDALARGDVEAALEAIDLEPAAFEPLRNILVQTYADAGADASAGLRGVRWNSASPRAEQYARNVVGTRITGITDDAVVAVRNSIADGYAFGRTPNRMALDLVGSIGANGRREGGIVGLSAQQEQWVRNMRRALETDPREALRFTRRDRRFDSLLRRSESLTQAQIDNIIRSYSNRLLLSRGRTIAVTERGSAINQGRVDAYANAVEKYGMSEDRIEKTWVYTNRSREPRVNHVAANKQKVMGLRTPFVIGGELLQYPHDPSASARHVANCTCEVKLRIV